MKTYFTSIAFVVTTALGSSASLVVDSFTEGEFMLSFGGDTSTYSPVTSPLGATRAVSISSRTVAAGSILTSTLDAGAGTLSFFVNGQSTGNSPLNLGMSYSGGGPFSLLGYDAFEFEVSSLSGTGFLIVELGSPSGVYGPETHRVAMDSPGVVTLPFSELNYGTGGAVDSFYVIRFEFEADSQEFSFVLDEIRVVPEPMSLVLFAVGSLALAIRHRSGERC